MLELTRTVRFCLDEAADPSIWASAKDNTYSAWPAMRGLGRYYEISVTCRGEADPQTGYFLNIKHIDEAVREYALPDLAGLLTGPTPASAIPMGELMQRMVNQLYEPLRDTVAELTLHLTPRYALSIRSDDMEHVIVRQQYEFSAAHRLHVPELSDAENREVFGKCNNPAGHGHNYRLEVAVRAPIDPGGRVLDVDELDQTVARHVIDKLDHKHLNHDVPAFKDLNPSVEHISQVIWQMLASAVGPLGPAEGAVVLEEVRVWETEKTVCTYRGPGDGISNC
ncbi:6-carboxytetrahydropterin synthase [Phycisphaerales bacterium AB-hyl4]|uniref:6-carboxy-5,6,7,8-tetrahydropterin synthase n=1 Tax=Natronomicrosphaera hydrolytica TaxID=3242702 RepID=A0ABV4U4T2_9BACT